MKRLTKYQTYCPLFPGFYNSFLEYSNEDSDIEHYNDENGTNYDYDDFEWNYVEYQKRVAKSFVNRLEFELNTFINVRINFQEIISPKLYNFSTDSVNVEIKVNLKELIGLISDRKDLATQYFKDKYTSCSGFISFHSNDINDWLNIAYIKENEAHRVGSLLECLATLEIDSDNITYWADDETCYMDYCIKESV